MNREIKFRAWDEEGKRWINLDECVITIDGQIHSTSGRNIHRNITDKVDVQQFTGLTDKNGKEIYEGDIVELNDRGVKRRSVVRFDIKDCDESCFHFRSYGWYVDEIKVIGNIYENPELLKN